jgi:hypothetical protein
MADVHKGRERGGGLASPFTGQFLGLERLAPCFATVHFLLSAVRASGST